MSNEMKNFKHALAKMQSKIRFAAKLAEVYDYAVTSGEHYTADVIFRQKEELEKAIRLTPLFVAYNSPGLVAIPTELDKPTITAEELADEIESVFSPGQA